MCKGVSLASHVNWRFWISYSTCRWHNCTFLMACIPNSFHSRCSTVTNGSFMHDLECQDLSTLFNLFCNKSFLWVTWTQESVHHMCISCELYKCQQLSCILSSVSMYRKCPFLRHSKYLWAVSVSLFQPSLTSPVIRFISSLSHVLLWFMSHVSAAISWFHLLQHAMCLWCHKRIFLASYTNSWESMLQVCQPAIAIQYINNINPLDNLPPAYSLDGALPL